MYLNDDGLYDATLDLPLADYKEWLEIQRPATIVGYELSKYDTPVGRFLLAAIGTCNQLHSDGKHAWFFLRLTRGNLSEADCNLRMMLPDWTAPLVAYYTSFPVGHVSSHPQEKGVSREQAEVHVRRLVERKRLDAISAGEVMDTETSTNRDADTQGQSRRRTRRPNTR